MMIKTRLIDTIGNVIFTTKETQFFYGSAPNQITAVKSDAHSLKVL